MLTKKHFKAIAEILRPRILVGTKESRETAIEIAKELSDFLFMENERFNIQTFYAACGIIDEK